MKKKIIEHKLVKAKVNEPKLLLEHPEPGTDFLQNYSIAAQNELLRIANERIAFQQQQFHELERREEHFHKMVEEVEDYAIILLDSKGIVLNWNKGAENILLFKEPEIKGKSFKIFYLPEERLNRLPERLLKEAAQNGRASYEGWRLRKDHSRFWGSINLTALHDDTGNVIGYSKITRDLSSRKIAEEKAQLYIGELMLKNEALRKSTEQFAHMVSEVQDYAIILLNQTGNIESWNAGAATIKGYTAEEAIGMNFRIFYTAEDRNNLLPEKLLNEAVTKGKALQEGWRLRKDGTVFWGSISITALHSEDNAIIGFTKVTRDLTERRLAQEKMQEYIQKLEMKNNELEQFAYVASHDLQEPVRKIQIFTELIEKDPTNALHVSKYLQKISSSAERMSLLIKSVLNISSIMKDREELVNTDLNSIIAQVILDYELLISEKKAVIQSSPLPVIHAIPPLITQLFYNLIGNALKFSKREPLITISSKVVSKKDIAEIPACLNSKQYLEISFTDNGIGFDQQYARLIFSMFQRLHGKQEYKGTGIGLALCQKIMEVHSGFIMATSELSKGSVFYLYFPC